MLRCHPEIKVVIIDPIVKFIDLIDFNEYGGAYDKLGPIKDILDGRGVAGIFSHHCKKAVSDVDAFDDLLGSTGWGAACDTRLVLRRPRGSDEGVLIAGGRDVLHSESALLFAGNRGWQYQGAAADVRISAERKEILDLLGEEGSLSATEISKRLQKNYNTTKTLVQKLLAAGAIVHDGKKVTLPPEKASPLSPSSPGKDTVGVMGVMGVTRVMGTTGVIEEEESLSLFPREHDDSSVWGAEEAVGLLSARGET
jgi:hypothetical protein